MDNKFDGVAFVEKLKELSGEEKQIVLSEKLAGAEDNCVQSASTWAKKLSQWNNGSHKLPTTEELLRISDLYGCSVDDLLGISSPRRASSTTYDLLASIDAAVQAGIADIEISEEGTAANMELVFPDDDDLLEYVKVCKVTTTNRRLVGLFDSYKQLTHLQKQNGLNNSICGAYFDGERKNATPLRELSPDDTILTYKPIGGNSSLPFE